MLHGCAEVTLVMQRSLTFLWTRRAGSACLPGAWMFISCCSVMWKVPMTWTGILPHVIGLSSTLIIRLHPDLCHTCLKHALEKCSGHDKSVTCAHHQHSLCTCANISHSMAPKQAQHLLLQPFLCMHAILQSTTKSIDTMLF